VVWSDPSVRNVALLTLCQALAMTGMTMNMTVTALTGATLTVDPALATLPLALQMTATMCTTLPASLYMRRVGRQLGFSTGVLIGVVGALIAAFAIFERSFGLFIFGSMLIGSFQGFAILYRYAAADTASEAFRPRAISLVLAGGVVAALVGPELSKLSFNLFEPVMFAGSFIIIALVQGSSLIFLSMVRIPKPTAEERKSSGRPLSEIVRQPVFIIAAIGSMIGYGTMAFLMTATPLAMIDCGFEFPDAAFVIQWHAFSMFAPSFFTGWLIQKFGVLRIMLTGAFAYLICVIINTSGIEMLQFFSGLVLLGIGWNFLFVGGTTLMTEAYRPEERAKVQGLGDFLVFSTVAAGSFSSGAIQHAFGWQVLNFGVLPLIVIVVVALLWFRSYRRAQMV
jgi:MFS family permease